ETPPELTDEGLLIRSYILGRQFVPEERAFHLLRLTEAASRTQLSLAKLWAEEVFQLTFELTPSWNRVATQKNALMALAAVDAERAFTLFSSIDLPVPKSDGSMPEDVRAHAAGTVFQKLWLRKGQSCLPEVRRAAQHLGETGQYPYLAMVPILKDVSTKDSAETQSLFSEAVSFYRRGSRVESADREFVEFLNSVWDLVPRPLMGEAVRVAVERLLQERSAEDKRYFSRVGTESGGAVFRKPSDELLFKLLPRLREVDPDWSRRIAEERPALGAALNGGVRYTEGVVVQGVKEATEAEISAMQSEGMETSRLVRIEEIAATNPEEALRLALTLTDPALRSVALATVGMGLSERKPIEASRLVTQAKQVLSQIEDDAGKVKAWTALAQAAAKTGDRETALDALEHGLNLGEELFEQDQDVHPGQPAIFATGFDELVTLVQVGIRLESGSTLARLISLRNSLLRAHLFIDAAQALSELRPKKPK
ncbi:MAG: hypothetical protein ACRD2M_08865, partial [Terriglobales bacterium]